jgi:hypothetical protein
MFHLEDISIPATYYHKATATIYYDSATPNNKRERSSLIINLNYNYDAKTYQQHIKKTNPINIHKM